MFALLPPLSKKIITPDWKSLIKKSSICACSFCLRLDRVVSNLNHCLAVIIVSSLFSINASAQALNSASVLNTSHILSIDPQSVDAKAWIILDPQSRQIVAEYQSDQQRAPASLTKMMVGYLALKAVENEQITLNQIVSVPDIVTSVQSDESRLKLKPQQQISVQELISGLIIMSANDAALTLATLISGDIPHFLDLMNQTAAQLGMHNTHFSNPSGITMQDHYSTAYDLALLSQAIVKETPSYLGYSKQPEFSYKDIYHHATNILLKKDPSVDGLKTGYTDAAGYNLALTANRLDPNLNEYRRLIVIVMGTTSKQKRADVAETLMNIAFNYTQTKRLLGHHQVIADIPVRNSSTLNYQVRLPQNMTYNTLSLLDQNEIQLNAKQFDPIQQRFILTPTPLQWLEPLKQPEKITYSVHLLQDYLDAPLQQKAFPVAQVSVEQFKKVIHQIDVIEDIELPEASWWQKLLAWCRTWIQSIQGHTPQAVIYPITSQ